MAQHYPSYVWMIIMGMFLDLCLTGCERAILTPLGLPDERVQSEAQGSPTSKNEPKKIEEKKDDDDKKINLLIRTDPANPQNEAYLSNWRITLYGIDDKGRELTGSNYGVTDWEGFSSIPVDSSMQKTALLLIAYNDIIPFKGCGDGECLNPSDALGLATCRQFEIFIPKGCFEKRTFVMSPYENAVWHYYRNAAARQGAGWNATQVDCDGWLNSLDGLLLTDIVQDELVDLQNNPYGVFRQEVISQAFRENQHFLVPTRPPICMSEHRHSGGGMNDGELVTLPITIDEGLYPYPKSAGMPDADPITIGSNGIVSDLCGVALSGELSINQQPFVPETSNHLKDRDFMGVISHQTNTYQQLDTTVFNTKLGNGRDLTSQIYEDACALTTVIKMTNTSTDEKDIRNNSGTRFTNLFGPITTTVYLTSDGDTIVDDNDTWAIFTENDANPCQERVLAVELLGHRQGDFQDVLALNYDEGSEDLFIGLIADFELNEEAFDGEDAYLGYTMHIWDGSTNEGIENLRPQFAACYLAADPWTWQYFKLKNAELSSIGAGEDCSAFCPTELAEFATRSQCFSNSRANQRWQNEDAGYWSINSTHNVESNIIINPGWLGPHLNVEVYVQKFDEAVFKGPRTIRTTDEVGQLLIELPTIVEGDQILLKAQDNCCSDYDLIIPCVPAFTGFAGETGQAYKPTKLDSLPVNL